MNITPAQQSYLQTITCNDAYLEGHDLVNWVEANLKVLNDILRLPADIIAQARHDMLLQVNAVEAMHKAHLYRDALEQAYMLHKGASTKAELHRANEVFEKTWQAYKAGGWMTCHRG